MIEGMPAADRTTTNGGERLRRAREEAGYSLSEFATELLRIRRLRGDEISHDTLRRRVIAIENGGALGGMWRADIAAVFAAEPDEFFGLSVQAMLPRPLLVRLPVDHDVLSVIAAQQQTHIRVEHMFGPKHAQSLVQHDLETVETLVKSTPADLRAQVRQAAGTIAEVAGWIAQDLGDYRAAELLTNRAELHLRSASPELRAMVWMRKSNIIARSDPDMAVELAADAARLIDGHEVGRLAASIARQRALAALANRDTRGFLRHAAHALEMGDVDPADEDTAVYANAGFVASEIATGYLRIEEYDKAIELLQRHHGTWTSHQHRDRAVADTRLLHASIAAHEYRLADTLSNAAITGYLAAPSERARHHLRQSANLLRDRRRYDKNSLLQALAGRIKLATQGDPT